MPSGGRKHISMYTQVYHQSASRSEVIYVLHPPTLTSPKMKSTLVSPPSTEVPKETIETFGFRTQFGGGKSTGFPLISESEADLNKFEVTTFLHPIGKCILDLVSKIEKPSRQQRKQRKNRSKKFRGTDKKKAASTDKNQKK